MNQKRSIYKLLAVTLIISLILGCNFLTGLGGDPDQEFIQELLTVSTEEADRAEQDMLNLLREQNGARAAFGDQADAIFLQMDQARAAALQDLMDQAEEQSGDAPKVSPRYTKDYQAESRAKLLMMFILSLTYADLPRDQNGNAILPKKEEGAPAGAAGTHYSMEVKLVGSRMEVTGTITSLITEPFPYEESMGFSLSLEICPDAQGNVPVQLSFQNAGGLRSGGGKQLGIEGQGTGHVNDEGRLASYEDKSTYHGASQPKNAGQGGGEDWGATNNYFEFQLDLTYYPDPAISSTSHGAYIRESSENDRGFTERAIRDLAYMKNVMIVLALQAAEERWTKGYCLEIKVSDIAAKGEKVSPNSDTPFTATVRHKFEGKDLTVPVIATLSEGQVSVNPSGSKVPAPANFTYKAPDNSGQKATVHLETRSKRGIANLDVKFTTGGGWKVDGPFGETHIFGEICSLEVPFTLDWDSGVGLAGTITFSPSSENGGTWSLEGALASGGVTNAGEGSYTIESSAEKKTTAIALEGTASQTTVGFGTITSPFSETIQLDPSECSQP